MKYSNDVFLQGEMKLKEIQNKNVQEQERRQKKLYALCPEFLQIHNTIRNTGLQVVKAVLEEGNAKELVEGLRLRNQQLSKRLSVLLEKQGFPTNYLDPIVTCLRCNDKGYIDGKKCICFKNLLSQCAFRSINEISGLEQKDLKNFRLDFYENKPTLAQNPKKKMGDNYQFVTDYIQHFNLKSPSILMMGNTGLGKTHLSMAIVKEVMEQGFGVVAITAHNLLAELEREHFTKNVTESIYQAVLACDLLVLDDLGSEFSTHFTVTAVNNIINTRIRTKRPTIISTNWDLKQLEKVYTNKLISRMLGEYTYLMFLGSDIRAYRKAKGI